MKIRWLKESDLTHIIDGVPLGITITVSALESGTVASSQIFYRESDGRRNVARRLEADATADLSRHLGSVES